MRMRSILVVTVSVVALAFLLTSCTKKPTGPVKVTLSWTGEADLDLMVDGNRGYTQGGSDDARQGPGSESLTLPAGEHAVDVYNNSGSGSGNATITIEIPGVGTETRTATVAGDMARDTWKAFTINSTTGVITDVNTFE